MTRSYIVRTYGCQMNEHDSERIAGLLEADGMVRAESEDDADVVVLNTCCIRENADNKLYGNLGHLKPWKEPQKTRASDRRVGLPGPERPRPRRTQKAKYRRRRDGHPQRAPRSRAARPTRPPRSGHRDPRRGRASTTTRCSPRHCPLAARPLTTLGSRSRSAATTTAPSASCRPCAATEISRPYADIVAEVERLAGQGVTEVTLLGQNVNSYGQRPSTRGASGRLVTARPPHVRCSPTYSVRPWAGCPMASRQGSVHQPAPEGHAARDVRGDGRHGGGV